MVQIIAYDGKPIWCRFSRNNVELIIGITIVRIDDTEILCGIIAVFSMEIYEDILTFAGLTNLWHNLLKMPSYGFAVAIHPQSVFTIYKNAIVWRGCRGIELWWSILNPTINENYRYDG